MGFAQVGQTEKTSAFVLLSTAGILISHLRKALAVGCNAVGQY